MALITIVAALISLLIRFEHELQKLEGSPSISALPEEWRRRYTPDLGITPPDDKDGVLQDMHWYSYIIGGAFQGYTIGNILSTQFFAAAQKSHPEIPVQIASGDISVLHTWLKTNLYQHGAKFTANELVECATGSPMSISPYIDYLKKKYGAIYQLS